ncbi:MAG: hypothetical protein GX774_05460 [Armatimonadetes bacterium]|nr:hypothetical protein [Armatimonadota bacterium]
MFRARLLLCQVVCLGLMATHWPAGARAGQAQPDKIALSEGFEGELPDFHTYQATYAADETRARTGKRSLRVTPQGASGGAYFRLQGLIDPTRDYVFSAWVYAESEHAASLYISASDGKTRHTKGRARREARQGDWVKMTGQVRAKEWRETDQEIMLAMTGSQEIWVDDVTLLATTVPDPPSAVYPEVERRLRAEANKRPLRLARGKRVVARASNGAFAPDSARVEARAVRSETVQITPDGLLIFAIDADEPLYVTGSVRLTPDSDLRPGLRVTILCNTTVVAAPMVAAEAWESVGNRLTGPAPEITGTRSPDRVPLTEWLLPKGRSYLTVAGPHFRPGGTFRALELRALERKVAPPSFQFALLSDTHLTTASPGEWMNAKMGNAATPEFAATLQSLAKEGIDFAILAGDMTDRGTREDVQVLAGVLEKAPLPVYGCIGNHDSYHSSSRPDLLELAGRLFPGGSTDYVIQKPPLRFIILDASYWRTPEGEFVDRYDAKNAHGIGLRPAQVEWLRKTLAEDTRTSTVVIWHYAFTNRHGNSSCGYKLPSALCLSSQEALGLLEAAPNVIATFCGHAHWNEVNRVGRITHLQNPAFAEWPNAFRVVRVYPDRLEWEVRQPGNRGFVRESFLAYKALSWMLSTGEGDLAGEVRF